MQKLIFLDNYRAVIKNSVGSDIFRNLYSKAGNKRKDILKDGKLSCAFFVSSVLVIFGLAKRSHATVDGLERDMKKCRWIKIKRPKMGSVLVWEMAGSSGKGANRHIGFYIGDGRAVSNSTKLKKPSVHHWTYGTKTGKPKRKVEAIYWHKKLG